MATLLTSEISASACDARKLTEQGDRVMLALGKQAMELSVLLIDDASMRELNRQYRDQDRSTDVLAFSQLEGEGGGGPMLGDVVISVETAGRQAEQHQLSLDQELALLLIHGTLHLLGYDHERSPEEAAIMKQKTWEIFSILYPGKEAAAACEF
jgi:probable rRNA maturation factor